MRLISIVFIVLFPQSGTIFASPKKGDPKTPPAAGRDVHRPDFIGINCFRGGGWIGLRCYCGFGSGTAIVRLGCWPRE